MHQGGKIKRQAEFVLYHCEVHDFILEKKSTAKIANISS
jgi:hypothetical protein